MKSIFFLFALFCYSSAIAQSPDLVFERTLIYSDEIYFDFGESSLRADGDSTLNAIITKYGARPKLDIAITAHTDAIGSNAANQKLSEARGASVKDFLVANGLSEDIIQTAVFGEEKPQSDNESEAGRQRNRRATIDIYQSIPITKLEGRVTDEKTGEGIEADIIIKSKEGRDSTRSDNTGKWSIQVPSNTVVSVDIYAEGYFFETQMLKTRIGKVQSLESPLPPMLVGETVAIKNLYFVGDKAELLAKSLPELPKVLKLMQINPLIKIEIGGHILKEQALNRRVEIKILETGKVISEEEKID